MASLRSRRSLRPVGFDELGLRRAISDRVLPFLVAAMAFLAALALAGWVGAASLGAALAARRRLGTDRAGAAAARAGGARRRRAAGPRGGTAGRHARRRRGACAQRRGTGRAAAALAGQRCREAGGAAARGDRGAAGRYRPGTRSTGTPAGGGGAGHAGRGPRRVDPAPFGAGAQHAGMRGAGAAAGGGGCRRGDCGGHARRGSSARREAIEIVHGLGATDGYIAARFAGRATLLAATGGIAGALLALPVLLALANLAAPFAGGRSGRDVAGRCAGRPAGRAVADAARPAGRGGGDRLPHRPGDGAPLAAALP